MPIHISLANRSGWGTMMPTDIEATYKVVTPMFCVGANPNRAELRLPSFKGVLRFWWRSLAWSRCGGDLATIQKEENALFGSAAPGCQSRVSMRLRAGVEKTTALEIGDVLKIPKTASTVGAGARYLGYGVMKAFDSKRNDTKAGALTHACLQAPFEFTVQMRIHELKSSDCDSLKSALVVLGLFGGIGAKSRKGYGSLVLQKIRVNDKEEWQNPKSIQELKNEIKSLSFSNMYDTPSCPEYTAFSSKSRHVLVTSKYKNPIEILDLVGRELVRYRSWGHKGKVLDGVDREENFRDDHDLMKRDSRQRLEYPRRIAFGLPHNYGSIQVGPSDKHLDRRASPLFIHIHKCGEVSIAVLSFLPARFLPKGKSGIKVGKSPPVCQQSEKDLYRPIQEFLDRLLDPQKRKEPFTDGDEYEVTWR